MMTHLFSKRWIAILLVPFYLITTFACRWAESLTNPTGDQTTPEVFTVDMEFGSGSFNLPQTTVGLADLSSYKATLTVSFDGTNAGQPDKWSKTYVMLTTKEPVAHLLTMETAGGVPAGFMAEVDGAAYERRGENACTASEIEEGSSLSAKWEPAGFLSGVIGADEAGSETINGGAASHYTFDERALGEPNTKSTGQLWVSSENGVIVRYLLSTKAGADFFGEGIEGTLNREYNLTDINQPVLIKLPDGCPRGQVDAPLMPDAQSVRRLPGVTIYSVTASIQDVLAFYQAQLPALGWEVTGEPLVADTMGLVHFVQGEQQLSVIATPVDNKVMVRIVVGTAPSPVLMP